MVLPEVDSETRILAQIVWRRSSEAQVVERGSQKAGQMGKQGLVVKKTITVVDGWSFILKGTVGCTLGAGSFKLGPVCAEDGTNKGMRLSFIFVVVIQSLSHVQLLVTP